MIWINSKHRSREEEIMDDFQLQGSQLKTTLEDLDKVNKYLGGNEITLEGVEKMIKSTCFEPPLHILDVGCGNGSLLKEVANLGRKKGVEMRLKGIDANIHAIEIARENCREYPEIIFEAQDVFSKEFEKENTDIVLCTLTLHHFTDTEIKRLLKNFVRKSNIGIVINDLKRSRLAYLLFQLFCAVFIRNDIAREDGLVSIKRSFRKKDLYNYGKNLKVRKQEIRQKWAFRYQWILLK
ncbi:MAG: methyltransferase domain-containing protein [Salinimicrobium sp.]